MRQLRTRSLLLLSAGLLVAAAAPSASAQVCLGLPPFADASVHLTAAAEFPDSARSFAASLGGGAPNGVFLKLGGGLVEYQGYEDRAHLGFAELGIARSFGRLAVCPVAGGYLAAGPDLFDVSVTTRGASVGFGVGVPYEVPLVLVTAIPRAAVLLEYVSQTAEQEGAGEATESTRSGVVDLGVGLVIVGRFTVQPVLHIPFARDDGVGPSFGVIGSVILPVPVVGLGR